MSSTYEQLIRRLVDNEPRSGYDTPAKLEWSGKLTNAELRIAMQHNRGDLDCSGDIDDRFIDPAIFAYTDLEYRLAAAVLVNHLRDVYRARVLELVWHDVLFEIEQREDIESRAPDPNEEYDPDSEREQRFWESTREVAP
jgi:hypothetical protein